MRGEGLSDGLVEGTLKFGGGSLMVWGCMMWEGVGNLVKIDGKMDTDLYQQIMEDDLLGSLDWYDKSPREIIFQQDGDPKHRCLVRRGWYQDHAIDLLPWPAQSADLAPIEHLWSHLKKKLKEYDHPAGGILELWERPTSSQKRANTRTMRTSRYAPPTSRIPRNHHPPAPPMVDVQLLVIPELYFTLLIC